MTQNLTKSDAEKIITQLRRAVPMEECWTCDCLQGLLTQLEMDADTNVADLTSVLKKGRDQMHGCLGCDPCPPGEQYSQYLLTRSLHR